MNSPSKAKVALLSWRRSATPASTSCSLREAAVAPARPAMPTSTRFSLSPSLPRSGATGRRDHRGVSPRRHGKTWSRSRRLVRYQRARCLRPHGRLGADRPLGAGCRSRHQFIALTGALAAIGKPGEPATIPLNLIGDFGGGSMFLAFGIVAALWERERSGRGQVSSTGSHR